MVDDGRVVLRLTIDLVLTSTNAKRFSPCGSLNLLCSRSDPITGAPCLDAGTGQYTCVLEDYELVEEVCFIR